jgi:hypothetical protein
MVTAEKGSSHGVGNIPRGHTDFEHQSKATSQPSVAETASQQMEHKRSSSEVDSQQEALSRDNLIVQTGWLEAHDDRQDRRITDMSKFSIIGISIAVMLSIGLVVTYVSLRLRPHRESSEVVESSVPGLGLRDPVANMEMNLLIRVNSGTSLPKVDVNNSLSSVELSFTKGAASSALRDPSNVKARTRPTNERDGAVWNECLTLSKVVFGQEGFINAFLCSSDASPQRSSTLVAHDCVEVTELLSGLQYDPMGEAMRFKDYTFNDFSILMEDSYGFQDGQIDVSPAVNISVSYLEIHRFKVSINKVCVHQTRPFVELRVVNDDPCQLDYTGMPGDETIWSGKTGHVGIPILNEPNKFDEELEFTIVANPAHHLMLCVLDGDCNTLDFTPVGMAVIPMKNIICSNEGTENKYEMKLVPIPKCAPSWGRVYFSISHELSLRDA